MKNKFLFALMIFLFSVLTQSIGQTQTPAQQVAERIAQKMKDTLGLNQQKKTQIYNINIQLHEWKTQARTQYGDSDTLGTVIQHIENKRDSLYRSVLPENKYQLYKAKKRNLISAN